MIPVSAPTRVAARLRAAVDGTLPVLHRGPDAVYVELDGHCLGLVGARATAVPCALRTSLDTLPTVGSASVRAGVLHLDGVPVVVGRLVDVGVPPLAAPGPGGGLSRAEVTALVGRGDGLTPYGDDVLCGWLAVHRAAGLATPEVDAALAASVHRTTLLSATLLDCAGHGEVIAEFAAWLAALGSTDEPTRAATLAAVGHSSGRGLLEGARRGLLAVGLEAAA